MGFFVDPNSVHLAVISCFLLNRSGKTPSKNKRSRDDEDDEVEEEDLTQNMENPPAKPSCQELNVPKTGTALLNLLQMLVTPSYPKTFSSVRCLLSCRFVNTGNHTFCFLIVLGSKSKADLDLQPVKGAVLMDIDDEPEVSDITKHIYT